MGGIVLAGLLLVLSSLLLAEEASSPLPRGAYARLGSSDLRHGGQVTAVAVSPDGRRIASLDQEGRGRVWDAATGKPLRAFQVEPGAIAMSFVRDSNAIAWATSNSTIGTLDLASVGSKPVTVPTGQQMVQWARFSRTGERLVTSYHLGVSLWRVPDANCLGSVAIQGFCMSSAIHPDGNRFLVSYMNNRQRPVGWVTQLCDANGKAIWSTKDKQGLYVGGFSSDGAMALACGQSDNKVHVLDGNTGAMIRTFSHGGTAFPAGFLFIPGSHRIAGVFMDGIRIWDANGRELARIDMPMTYAAALTASPDGRFLVTAGPGCRVGVWDAATGKDYLPFRGHAGPVTAVAFAEGGLISLGADGTARRWSLSDGNDEVVLTLKEQEASWLALSADGRWAASQVQGERPGVAIWDLRSRKLLRTISAGENGITAGTLSPDGQRLALAETNDNGLCSISLWHAPSGRAMARIDPQMGAGGGPDHMAFSADGKLLAMACAGLVRLYEVATGKSANLTAESGTNCGLAFTPDGRRLAEVVGALRVCDLQTSTIASEGTHQDATPQGDDGKQDTASDANDAGPLQDMPSIAFSADGKRLATGCEDGSILLWNAPAAKRPPATQPADAAGLAALWGDLASAETAKALKAAQRLTREGPAAVTLVRDRLKPLPPGAKTEDLDKLLADLDSDSFRARDAASKKLAASATAEYLRAALDKAKDDEVRARLADLLAAQAGVTIIDLDELRSSRAVRVLELIAGGKDDVASPGSSSSTASGDSNSGASAALDVLKSLAAGGPGRQTRDAAAALGRLGIAAAKPSSASRPRE